MICTLWKHQIYSLTPHFFQIFFYGNYKSPCGYSETIGYNSLFLSLVGFQCILFLNLCWWIKWEKIINSNKISWEFQDFLNLLILQGQTQHHTVQYLVLQVDLILQTVLLSLRIYWEPFFNSECAWKDIGI